MEPKFQIAKLYITPGARSLLKQPEIDEALTRHVQGAYEEIQLEQGLRLYSANQSEGVEFFVITDLFKNPPLTVVARADEVKT